MNKSFLLYIFSISIFLSHINGQEQVSDTLTEKKSFIDKTTDLADSMIDMITWEKPKYTFSLFPVGGYSPRTGFEFGIMPVFQINTHKEAGSKYTRTTTIAPYFMVSTKGMYSFDIDMVAFTQRQWFFIVKTQYMYLPDTYYGIGNGDKEEPYSEYNLQQFSFLGNILKGWKDKFFIGLQTDFNYSDNTDINGDLLTPDVPGYAGGWANGIGPMVAFDTRDNISYPSKGWYITASSLWYFSNSLGDYGFSAYNVNLRKFFSIKDDKMVLAAQAYLNITDGNTPFNKLSALGGKRLLRGIPSPLKYIDDNAWYVQTEYRQHIWWKVGAVVFAGTGRVFNNFDNSFFKDLHFAGGAGVRFKVLPDDGLNLRLDFGMTNRGDNAVYVTLREAF
ncbi:MAG: BamA/TamA family outer membrane protein [Chlorobi bacterium]|nr:BamA/TamA family outer membrane protein [Chlorobiota bacterium]